MKKYTTAKYLAGVATAAVLSFSPLAAGANTTVKSAHTTTSAGVALNQQLAGWNLYTSAANQFVLGEILNLIWGAPFTGDNKFNVFVNKDIVTSATTATVSGQQVVTYKINPKAVWSDGTAITADDFIYNWQAQCGGHSADAYCSDSWTDKGGQTYDAAGTAGYNQIQSVVGSAPKTGSCSAGSSADRNAGLCPNGLTVTVKFIKGESFAEWQGIFGLVPAHIARSVGWNGTGDSSDGNTPQGFDINPVASVLSDEQYVLHSYDATNNNVILTKNPRFWGTPGKLDQIVFNNLDSDGTGLSDLQNGAFNVWQPNTTSLAYIQNAQAAGVHYTVVPGIQFEHFDFNQRNPYLAQLGVRQAIAYGTDRKAIIAAFDPSAGAKPDDNHMFVPTQSTEYVANGSAYDNVNVSKAKALLKAAGMTMGSDGYFHPTWGSQKGQDLTFNMYTTTNGTRALIMQMFQGQMKNIGIKLNYYGKATFFSADYLYGGNFDIAEFAWVGGIYPSGNQSIYCSWSDPACASNYDHYSNPKVDALVFKATTEPTLKAEVADFNAADKLVWADMATLPIYQKPNLVAWQGVNGVINNATSAGVTWNAQTWSLS